MTGYSRLHVLALLKGTVEGDPYKHFGSLLGIAHHDAAAQQLGLLTNDGNVTVVGRAFYVSAELGQLPAGRANDWSSTAPAALGQALRILRELEDR